jgi:hypothetical protein
MVEALAWIGGVTVISLALFGIGCIVAMISR